MATTAILNRATVAVVRSQAAQANELQYDEIRQLVQQAVTLAGGFDGLIHDGKTVVIKPNLISNRDFCLPHWGGNLLEKETNGVTADWRVAKAVVELVRQVNPSGKVYIMEGSIVNTAEVMEYLNYTAEFIPGVDGFLPIESDSGVWQDKSSDGLVKVELPNGLLHKGYYLNKKYLQCDVLISIPCLKNHWHACVTGAIKNVSLGATPANIYGIDAGNPARNNMVDHEKADLHAWIHDYYLCRPVDFVVMDGLQGCQNGPIPSFEMNGATDMRLDQKNMRLILAGRDAVALDTIESLVMNWDPLSVPYLALIGKSGAGIADVASIDVTGCQVDEVRCDFEGLIPPAGGCKIESKEAPVASVTNCNSKDNLLRFSLAAGADVIKVEVYVDGKRIAPVIVGNYEACQVDLGQVASGRHEVRVSSFDRFLNRNENVVVVDAE